MARRQTIAAVLLALAGTASTVAAEKPAAAPLTPPSPSTSFAPLDAYAEAAATTILAEQNCPGAHLRAGRLTTLRLATKVVPAQEGVLEAKLRGRAAELRQRLAADGRDAWCDAAFDAFGPEGKIAKDVLVRGEIH